MGIRNEIEQAQAEALRKPWSFDSTREARFIRFSERMVVGLSLNK